MGITTRTPALQTIATGIIGALSPLRDSIAGPSVKAFDKALADYSLHTMNRMEANPWRAKAAITGETVWYGEPSWYPDEGGEDLHALEEAAFDKLDRTDLTPLERA